MKLYRRICVLALAFALLLAGASAQGLNAKWTLGNILVALEDREFVVAPEAGLEIIRDENALKLEFGLDMGGKTLLPVVAELSPDAVNFSLGNRVYSLDMQAIIDDLGLTDAEKDMLVRLGETIRHALPLVNMDSSAYMKENDEIINRMYEILVGRNAQETQVTVGEIQLPGRSYTGQIKPVHIADLFNYMQKCENGDIALFADSLLQLLNAVTGEEHETYMDYYYDDLFSQLFEAEDGEALVDAEILFAYNDDLVYEKATYTSEISGENQNESPDRYTTVNESIVTESGVVTKVTETYSGEDGNSSAYAVVEMDGSRTAPTAIRLSAESDDGYVQENEMANLTLTVRNVSGLSFEAVRDEGGLWTADLSGSQDTASAYDYGGGPVVLNDEFDLSASYAETLGADGRITGKAEFAASLDGESAALSFEIGRGSGAEIAPLAGENTQTFTLDADTDSMGYKLLAADALAFAASAAELYADPGVYGLMNEMNKDGPDWPEDLGDDIYNRYNRAYHTSYHRVYRFADAARVFEGNMPRYSEPENSVLTGMWAGTHNLMLNYGSNDGNFNIDISYLSDQVPAPTNPVLVSLEDFTFVEEDGILMAYYCDGDYLVFFDFEHPDRARAEEIISGLMLASKKVGLSA